MTHSAAIGRVFVAALPFATLAFLLSWRLEEIPLRATSRALGSDEAMGMPVERASAQQMAMLLARQVDRENRRDVHTRLASEADVPLPPHLCWLLFRIGELTDPTLRTLEDHLPLGPPDLAARVEALADAGLLLVEPAADGSRVSLTAQGRAALERLVVGREARLAALLEGWSPKTIRRAP